MSDTKLWKSLSDKLIKQDMDYYSQQKDKYYNFLSPSEVLEVILFRIRTREHEASIIVQNEKVNKYVKQLNKMIYERDVNE
jgi:hypothetical protein